MRNTKMETAILIFCFHPYIQVATLETRGPYIYIIPPTGLGRDCGPPPIEYYSISPLASLFS